MESFSQSKINPFGDGHIPVNFRGPRDPIKFGSEPEGSLQSLVNDINFSKGGQQPSVVGPPPPYEASTGAFRSNAVPMASMIGRSTSGFAPFALAQGVSSGIRSVSDYLQNKERLGLQKELYEKEMDAARSAGLAHPSQFNSVQGGLGKWKGGRISSVARTNMNASSSSPYSF